MAEQGEITINRVKCLKDFGDSIVKDQKDRLQNFQKNDTGRLSQSLTYVIINTIIGPTIEFRSEDYAKYVDRGRAPYIGYPAMRLIRNPMELRRRRMAREGTKPFMIFSASAETFPGDVFSQTRMNKFYSDYQDAALLDIIAQWDDVATEFNNSK